MSDDGFNMSLRKFLKKVGVTSQQEIEAAVRAARDADRLPTGSVDAVVTVEIDGLQMRHRITGEIEMPGQDGD